MTTQQLWDLMGLYYKLGDGVAWAPDHNPDYGVAAFRTRESARTFKQAAPRWTVSYELTPWTVAVSAEAIK
jgi:hypothetical protein